MTRRQSVLGVLLIVTGLAQMHPGGWAVEGMSRSWLPAAVAAVVATWIAPVLWLVSMLGLLLAGFALLEVLPVRVPWRPIALTALGSSIVLIALFWSTFVPVALLFIVVTAPLVLRWTDLPPLAVAGANATPGAGEARTSVSRRPSRAHRIAQVASTAALVYLAALMVLRPWYMHWGSSVEENHRSLPSDAVTPFQAYQVTRAITIHAPATVVWQWLAQMGQDRAGVYSYDWLERAFGLDVHNVYRIVPEWQHRAVGDLLRAAPPTYMGGRFGTELGLRVARVEPNRSIALTASVFNWGFDLQPVDAQTTRLFVRTRVRVDPSSYYFKALFGMFVLDPAHFIMERKMMLTIKERAESTAG